YGKKMCHYFNKLNNNKNICNLVIMHFDTEPRSSLLQIKTVPKARKKGNETGQTQLCPPEK
ncbi:Hypothetical predicted protein, partial [Podarcis lilfordi]